MTSSQFRTSAPHTDRRAHERFDVIGPLWGALELPEVAAIVNASQTGLLIEARVCPQLHSVQDTDVQVDASIRTLQSSIRHVRPIDSGRFLIGLEFVETPPEGLASTTDGAHTNDPADRTDTDGGDRP